MFNKDKKYTIEEFKEMFEDAKKAAIEKFDTDMEKVSKENGKDDAFQRMMMSMQNMLICAELSRILFNVEDTD